MFSYLMIRPVGKAGVAAEATSGDESLLKANATPADDPGETDPRCRGVHELFDTAGVSTMFGTRKSSASGTIGIERGQRFRPFSPTIPSLRRRTSEPP